MLIAYELRLLLGVMMRISVRAIEERLMALGVPISALQYLLLTTLRYHPLTLSEISRKVLLDPSTVSTAVDALVRKGYLARGHDPRDRRRVPLSLTEMGHELIASLPFPLRDDLLTTVIQQLGHAKAESLRDLLHETITLLPEGDTILREVQEFVALHARPLPHHHLDHDEQAACSRSADAQTTAARRNAPDR